MAEPQKLTAGDRWAWSRADLAEAWPPADGWALTYHFAPLEGGAPRMVQASPAFEIDMAPAATALFAPGRWFFAITVTSATDRRTVGEGWLDVAADPASVTAPDQRSRAQRILAAIEATLEKRASADADAFTIEGRSISRTPMADLLKARARFAEEVRRELGGAMIQKTRVAFK